MASHLWKRVLSLAPKAKKVVTCLIRIASQEAAAAFPDIALLLNVIGAASEQAVEDALDALQPHQQAQVKELLDRLIESHQSLIQHLEPLADEAHTVEELTSLVRESLERVPDWKKQYERFARDLTDIAATLERVEAKMDRLSVQLAAGLEEIHLRFDELGRKPKSPYGLSIHDEEDVAWLSRLYAESRTWSADQRRALRLEQFATLLVEAGHLAEASAVCADGVALNPAPDTRAAFLFQKMRADLERNAADEALAALREAVRLDPVGGAFPAHQYEPIRILGVGGAGTAVLCKNLYEDGAEVVVKRLHTEGLERKPVDLFREAPVLRRLAAAHPDLVVALHSYGFADPISQRSPYLVMDYFPGVSLRKHLDGLGRGLPLRDFLAIAEPVARALHASHALGVLHRDVKPDNVLVLPSDAGWQVRLIDFGLAVKCEVARYSQMAPRKTVLGLAAAGTADFAAPEQMGKRKESIGPYSDVYGFGRFCCYTLFRTATPLARHWRDLPAALRDLVEKCVEDDPRDRPQDFESILAALQQLHSSRSPSTVEKSASSGHQPVAAAMKPKGLPSQHFQVDVPGKWYQRPSDADPDVERKQVCDTPATIEPRPGEVYRWEINGWITDADLVGLPRLRDLTALQSLWLQASMYNRITDAGLAHVCSLTALKELRLDNGERITDAGLAHLSCLTGLESLNLDFSNRLVAAKLAASPSPTFLDRYYQFQSESITDAGLAHLRRLTGLKKLSLSGCDRITDAGLAQLGGLPGQV